MIDKNLSRQKKIVPLFPGPYCDRSVETSGTNLINIEL